MKKIWLLAFVFAACVSEMPVERTEEVEPRNIEIQPSDSTINIQPLVNDWDEEHIIDGTAGKTE